MTKHLRFLFVMLLAMIWSAGWAAETKTVVCTLAQKSNACTADVNGVVSWSYVNATSTDKNHRGIQWSAPKDVILTANFTSVVKITEVVVNANTNIKNNGNCTIALNVGSTSYGEKDIAKGDANAGGNANYSYIGTESSNVMTLKLNSSRSLYINTVTITYEVGDSKTDTKVSFGENSGKTFTFTEGKYSDVTFTTPTATEKDNIAGTIKYSSDNTAAISVDASTGALSFPGYGEATITATFTPNNTETYAVSTDSYKVKNERGVVAGTITFDKANGAFEELPSSDYDANGIGNFSFISDSKESFTFDCTRVLKSEGCIQLKKTAKAEINKIVSPTFSIFTNGYKVNVIYSSKKGLKLSAGGKDIVGSTTATNDNGGNKGLGANVSISVPANASFVMTSGSEVVYISKIEIIPNKVDETTVITLNENSESNTIEAKTGVNVTLKRTMVKGEWNTICLPFAVTEDKAKAAFGNDVKIVELDEYATVDHNVLSFKASTGIAAATPYLIKPSTVADEYTFENVDITDKVAGYSMTKNADVAFKGIYNTVDITSDVVDAKFGDYYAAFLGAGNKIYKAGTGMTKGFRAYFAIPNSASASALRVVIDGTATSIKNIDSEVVESNAPVYNLQGQRVDGNNLTPGIYVKAGKKFVVK